MERKPISRVAIWACRLLAVAATLFLLMWPIGYFRYTSVGVDRETPMDGDRVQMDYYRVRWPGNGDVWFGGGAHVRSITAGPPEPFDPASTFFMNQHPLPEPRSIWNRLGWWYFAAPASDPCDAPPGAPLVWGWWFGVPGWFPAILLGAWPAWRWRRCTRFKMQDARQSKVGT